MDPSSFAESSGHSLSPEDRSVLLDVAHASIAHGIQFHQPLPLDPTAYSEPLRVPRGTFVTIKREGQLRGCIGTLEANAPLVESVARNAHAAAIHDPRFAPVTPDERVHLDVQISILSEPVPMNFADEQDLLSQLRVGIDGLILEESSHRATLLPSVWESVPDPARFVQQLKIKAGLSPDFWSPNVKVSHYTAELLL